ncbi:MAG: hypothetical protein WCX28_07195 [Bacteriovoracaceae bacterium]|nr:hypothetical protein [Bacteroidota bacterium]
MNHLTDNEWEQIVSLYIDGELDADEKTKLEAYLATHPVAAREVEVLRTAKRSLSSKEKLPANDWFWLKLSNRLEGRFSHQPYRHAASKPSIAISTLAVVTFFVIGVIYFKDAPMFHHYFIEKKLQVESVYRNNIMTGNILPLFSNLNNDDVLNFALSGSIAIDSSNNTSLQVKNSDDSGSQIQIIRNEDPSVIPVTMNDFADEIGISHNQREVVDSILGSYKEKLQASVLVSENDEVAIHAELVDLNRAMVSTIAACLEPPQRTRFKRFLDHRKAPYALVAVNSPTVPSHIILNKIPRFSNSNNYVVISPDTVEIAEMTINVDSIREVARRQEMKYRKIITERMVAELTDRQRRMEENFVGMGQNRVRVHSTSGAFQIHFEHSAPVGIPGGMVEMVKPRIPAPEFPRVQFNHVTVVGDSAFSFEIPADDQTVRVFKRLPKGEFRFEIVDSMMREPKMKLMFKSPSAKRDFESRLKEMNEQDEDLMDLDSLLRESELTPEQPAVKLKKPGKESEVELMM